MKLKLFMGIGLAVGLTAGIWSWVQSRPQPAREAVTRPVTTSVKVAPAALAPPRPFNAPKMNTIMAPSMAVQRPVLSPSKSAWPAVQQIVDGSVNYEDRLKAINSISGRLAEGDWEVLKGFLLKPDGLDKEQLGQVIKNQLLDMLCALTPPPAELGDVLTKMYQNHEQDEVIRNYAVQHMTAYYEQIPSQTGGDQARQAIESVLWEADNETSDSIGGTALLALARLSQEYTGFDQGKITSAALQMAGDNNAGELTQVTAFQVCAQLGASAALPVILQAAQNGETISVRISAIGALGQLGGPGQIAFLNGVLSGPEARLRPVAEHALDQINARKMQVAGQQ